MGRTRPSVGHPAASLLHDFDYRDSDFVASSDAYLPAGRTKLTIGMRFSPFSVRNKHVSIILNRFKVFTANAGGPSYTPTPGSDYQIYWYLHRANNVPSDATITAANQRIPVTRPYRLDFDESMLPQPDDAGYDGTLQLTLYWGNTAYVYDFAAEDEADDARFLIDRFEQEISL